MATVATEADDLSRGSHQQAFLEELAFGHFPALEDSMRRVKLSVNADHISQTDIIKYILLDPSITAKVLQMANDVYYNVSGYAVTTITQAVVLLGIDGIKKACEKIPTLSGQVKDTFKKNIVKGIFESIHAAIQARSIVELHEDKNGESIFVTALLYRMGELSLWWNAGKTTLKIEHLMNEKNIALEQACKQTLGLTANQLTLGLAREWHFGKNLLLASETRKQTYDRWGTVNLSHELVHNLNEGWNAIATHKTIARIATYTEQSYDDTLKYLQDTSKIAYENIKTFCKDKTLLTHIPKPKKVVTDAEKFILESTSDTKEMIFEKIQTLKKSDFDVNKVLKTIIQSIYKDAGLDRSLVAILNKDRTTIETRFLLQSGTSNLRKGFCFNLDEPKGKFFKMIMKQGLSLWVNQNNVDKLLKFSITEIAEQLESYDFFIAPIRIGQKSIGIFYADRQLTKRSLDSKSFEIFKLLTDQCRYSFQKMGKPTSKSGSDDVS